MIGKGKVGWFFVALLVVASTYSLPLPAQEQKIIREGAVSYLTGQNIYVKFEIPWGLKMATPCL